MPACRRTQPALGLVFVDAGCVLAAAVPPCEGTLDLTSAGDASPYAFEGLSAPEATGRWSDGGEASFACRVRTGSSAPHTVRFATTAFLLPGGTQHLVVGMNGVAPATFVYDAGTPARELTLPIPEAAVAAGVLHVTFRFPDAVSPRDAGISRDPRRLAIAFRAVSFAAETRSEQAH